MSDYLVIDLTNYVDKTSDLVPPGTYRVMITDAVEGVSKNGNKKVTMGLKIIGGEFPGQDIGEAMGARIIDEPVTQGPGAYRFVAYLKALKLWGGDKKELKIPYSSLVNRQVMITVANGEPWNGRIKSEVQDVNRVPKAPKDPDSEPVFSGGLPVDVPPELRGRKMDGDEIDDLVADTVLSRLGQEFPPSPESPQVQDLGTVDGNEFSPIDLDNLTL